MVKITIDGIRTEVPEGTKILEAAESVGIRIPRLCYFKEINEVAACRVCVVEVEGADRLLAACNTVCSDGMVIKTNSRRVRNARKNNVKLILTRHNTSCTSCIRDGSCALQDIAKEFNITSQIVENPHATLKWDLTEPLIRDDSKCVTCFRCYNECHKIQELSVWDILGTGRRSYIGLDPRRGELHTMCALCGQCITHCPTGALTARDDTSKFYNAVDDPDVITVVQVAPAVRSAYGEMLGLPKEVATEKRMAAAIKALGVDYVFDTNFTADLTIMEEGSELLQFLGERDGLPKGEFAAGKRRGDFPMFTSCCPGWVRYIKMKYPEMVPQLSSAKSPQQMFGSVTKSYFAERIGVDPEKIFCISIMPCTAKKYECDVPELQDAAAKDVDMVLTTREFSRLLRTVHTGGVMEAALRSAYFLVTGEKPAPEVFCDMGPEGRSAGEGRPWREAEYNVGDAVVRTAVTSGLANTGKLIEAIKAGEVSYDFVEIMACPGGCAGGGGQPIHDGEEYAACRGSMLDRLDEANAIRYSHENPDVIALYDEYFGEPLSHKSHELLHTDQSVWTL